MSTGIWIGLLIGGLLAVLMSGWGHSRRFEPRVRGKMTKPAESIECHWCDRMIHLPSRACITICDHDLKVLALSHPDKICRARLQEFEYQFFGEARTDRPTQEPE